MVPSTAGWFRDHQYPQSWRKPTAGDLTQQSCPHCRLWCWDRGREETSIGARVLSECCVQGQGVWVGTD